MNQIIQIFLVIYMLVNFLMNLLVHSNLSSITKQLTNSLNSIQNLVNSLVDLDSLCTSVYRRDTLTIKLLLSSLQLELLFQIRYNKNIKP
jgi:hypothetical protein